jgi:inner membrane protein
MPSRRLIPALLLVIVLVADLLLRSLDPPYPALGLLDEPAHLATAALVLLLLSVHDRTLAAATLVAAVALDVDHLPQEAGAGFLTEHTARPVTHSLAGLAMIAAGAAALSRRRAVAAGVALGIAAHLFRDLATGGGVPLLWPLTFRELEMPYAVYAGVLIFVAAGVTVRKNPALKRNLSH